MGQMLIDVVPEKGFAGAVEAMTAAAEHANRETPGWHDAALLAVLEYDEKPEFLGEDVRYWASARGLPPPPDGRAWGAVLYTAARQGLIRKVGYGRKVCRGSHPSIGTIWRKKRRSAK